MKLLGQPHIATYLLQGLSRNRLSPSLLFVGASGVGKRTAAVKLVQAMYCERSPEICGQCTRCIRVAELNHPDFLFVDLGVQASLLREKAESQNSLKIETIRHVDNFLQLKSLEGVRRTAVIQEAERMTVDAANALLKTLEEPPQNAQIVLIANDERNLPSTILSRCALLRFRPLPEGIIAAWLMEHHDVPADRAAEIATRSGGSFTRARFLKDQTDEAPDLSDVSLQEFLDLLSESAWRKEGRKRAGAVISHLIEVAQKKLNTGDTAQINCLERLEHAREQIDAYVSPRLVMENLYLQLYPVFKGAS